MGVYTYVCTTDVQHTSASCDVLMNSVTFGAVWSVLKRYGGGMTVS